MSWRALWVASLTLSLFLLGFVFISNASHSPSYTRDILFLVAGVVLIPLAMILLGVRLYYARKEKYFSVIDISLVILVVLIICALFLLIFIRTGILWFPDRIFSPTI